MKRYIVVDDDRTNNMICKLTINRFEPTAEVKLFDKPEEALAYIKNEEDSTPNILFLDINMPSMTGWEFLTEFTRFKKEIRDNYLIYMLSSCYEDLNKETKNYPFLGGFYTKPLKVEYLREMRLKQNITY